MTYEPADILRRVADLSWTPRFSRKGLLLFEVPEEFDIEWYADWNSDQETMIAVSEGVWYFLKPDGLLTAVTYAADGSFAHAQYRLGSVS